MNIATASLSRQGTRASNQDQTGETIGERSACFVVCDGIAGLPGGEVAAELARNSIISRFDGDKHLNAQHIRDYVQTANRTILSEQQAVQDYRRRTPETAACTCFAAAGCGTSPPTTAWCSR